MRDRTTQNGPHARARVTPRAVTALLSVAGGVFLGAAGGVLIGLLIGVGLWIILIALGAYQ